MIDIKKIIAAVSAEIEQTANLQQIEVTDEQILARVREMAHKGYLPNTPSVKAVEAYLKGYGLWLSGNAGTGKTAFFKTIRPLNIVNTQTHERLKISIFSMLGTLGMSIEDLNDRLEMAQNDELVLDDVGAEPVFNFYGGKFEILPYILEKRLASTCRTHMTTNRTVKELGERYGERVIDRFKEMFCLVKFTGESKRHEKPNAEIVRAVRGFQAQKEQEHENGRRNQRIPQEPRGDTTGMVAKRKSDTRQGRNERKYIT